MTWSGTVLVAEPDQGMMDLLCDVFARQGLDVDRHNSALSALDAFAYNPVDVLLLDADFGCRSPFEVMRDVQMLAEHPDAPIVLIWTRSSLGSLWAELQHSCERVIPEPIDPGEVAAAVQELCRTAARAAV